MAVGQVGFKDQRKVGVSTVFCLADFKRLLDSLQSFFRSDLAQVKRIHVAQRENPIINRLNKTKVEKFPDLAMEREARQKELRKKDRAAQQARVSSPSLYSPLHLACALPIISNSLFVICSLLPPCRSSTVRHELTASLFLSNFTSGNLSAPVRLPLFKKFLRMASVVELKDC